MAIEEATPEADDALGVEDEDIGRIEQPFDPSKIRVRFWTPTLDALLKRMKHGELDLEADFQRMAGVWRDDAQSRLIESILIRIPIPAFYFDGLDEDRMVVIDGIQRLTALRRFVIDKTLKLGGLEFLEAFEGKGFDDLPRSFQRRIDETMVTAYVVEKPTPSRAKLNIFKRINTGGEPLRAQEIRHAMNPGPVRDFLMTLAKSSPFLSATRHGISSKRMDDRECVARFLAFTLTPPTRYGPADLDGFVSDGMEKVNEISDAERADLARRFDRAMRAASAIFDDDAFRKRVRAGDSRRRVNKALFEAWSVNLDRRTDAELAALAEQKDEVKALFIELMRDSDFDKSISQGTGDTAKVRLRFGAIRKLIDAVVDTEPA